MAIPTLGYPSITAAILGMRARGMSDAEIGSAIDLEPYRVRSFVNQTKHRKERAPCGRISIRRQLALPLDKHAARRGLLLTQLVERLVETIAKEDLVAAILDDEQATTAEATDG